MEENNTSSDIHPLIINGHSLTLIGTAHVSKKSAELVEETIINSKPDAVAVELCQGRYDALMSQDRWKNTNIVEVIKSGKGYVLFTQLILGAYQKRVATKLGVKPGAEMLVACEKSKEIGAKLELIDRDVKITLRRAWASLSWWKMMQLFFSGLSGMFEKNAELTELDIEKLKEGDALSGMMKEFAEALPEVKKALIDERDLFMSKKLFDLSQLNTNQSTIAVLGAGHIPGMKKILSDLESGTITIDLEELSSIPAPGIGSKLMGWFLPLSFVGIFIYGFIHGGASDAGYKAVIWFLSIIIGGFVGGILALGHPLSALAGGLSAPFTTLHPFFAAGMFSSMTEAWLRKPLVNDFESFPDDIATLKGWFKNKVAKVFVVFVATNLGVLVGGIIGVWLMVKW